MIEGIERALLQSVRLLFEEKHLKFTDILIKQIRFSATEIDIWKFTDHFIKMMTMSFTSLIIRALSSHLYSLIDILSKVV